jgi:hypothetical protein
MIERKRLFLALWLFALAALLPLDTSPAFAFHCPGDRGHDTTTEAYAYAREHRQQVEGYLEANPEVQIALSVRIQSAIDQASTEPKEEQ